MRRTRYFVMSILSPLVAVESRRKAEQTAQIPRAFLPNSMLCALNRRQAWYISGRGTDGREKCFGVQGHRLPIHSGVRMVGHDIASEHTGAPNLRQ